MGSFRQKILLSLVYFQVGFIIDSIYLVVRRVVALDAASEYQILNYIDYANN